MSWKVNEELYGSEKAARANGNVKLRACVALTIKCAAPIEIVDKFRPILLPRLQVKELGPKAMPFPGRLSFLAAFTPWMMGEILMVQAALLNSILRRIYAVA